MHEILVPYLRSEITINRVHTEHHRCLYAEHLLPTLREQLEADSTDQLSTGLGEWYIGWASSEVILVGYLSLFHLWERQITGLLRRQLQRDGASLPDRRRGSTLPFVKRVLESEFGISLDPIVWKPLDLGLLVANAINHGGRSLEKLTRQAPEFVAQSEEPDDPRVVVSEEQFGQLCDGLVSFWEALPHKVDYASREPSA